ncbi:hypothetical protein JCM18899A_53860 [Nocardioides sp. AN3]
MSTHAQWPAAGSVHERAVAALTATSPVPMPVQMPARPLETSVLPVGARIGPARRESRLGRVEAGLVAVVRRDSREQEAVIEVRGAGAVIGVDGLIGHRGLGRSAMLEALVPTRITWVDVAPASETTPAPLLGAVMSVLAASTRQQQDAAWRRRTQSVPQRVAEQLVDVWAEEAHGQEGSALAHLTRKSLARIVGCNTSVLSTACGVFERRGWCRRLGRPDVELDVTALNAFASRGLPELSQRPLHRLRRHESTLWDLVTSHPHAACVLGDWRACAHLWEIGEAG